MVVKIMISQPSLSTQFRIFALLFLAGIFLGKFSFFPGHLAEAFLLFVAGLIFFSVATPSVSKKWYSWATVILVGAFLWSNIHQEFFSRSNYLPPLVGKNITLKGSIDSFPERKSKHQQVSVAVEKISLDTSSHETSEKTLLIFPDNISLDYGQKVTMSGKLTRPHNFNGFDYRKHLARHNIHTVIRNPKIIPGEQEMSLLSRAKKVRDFFEKNIKSALPNTHAVIGTGMLLGVEEKISEPAATWIKNSGLQHLLVVSGTNVSILFFLVVWLLQKLGRRITIIVGASTLLFFVLMTGADPPVVRAGLMGAVVLVAQLIGRLPDYRNSILLAAVIMTAVDPKMIQFDISFWLSFSAMLGIIVLAPVFYAWLKKIFPPKICLLFAVSLAAQVSVFPLISFFFDGFPFTGLITNMIVEPLVPVIMGTASLTAITGFIPAPINQIIGLPAYFCIELLLLIAKLFSFSPTAIPHWITFICGGGATSLFVWGLLSKKYAQKYLQPFEQFLQKRD